jgi:V/A-type H+-transporting ATPase subunit G/H
VAEAKAQAAQMKAAMTKSARESAVGAEEDAKAQSEQMMQAAGAEEGKDLEALQKAVAEKQQKAVEVILSELL